MAIGESGDWGRSPGGEEEVLAGLHPLPPLPEQTDVLHHHIIPLASKAFFSSNKTKPEEEKPSNRENPQTCDMTILISKLHNMLLSEMPRNAGGRGQVCLT